ncbi:MICOS complex subunit Mic60 isoform X1 [Onthophagus taurus]|uniref:MICOS complex subunit Mic60 isoform X1 n=1 Tax=Onthophagus taurus TaxID=166361 RepID=UPI000C206DE2|nr:MICOS complex subunit Mic60 isoform X2 [Onthophagus taurus]
MFRIVSASATRFNQGRCSNGGATSRIYKNVRCYSKENQRSELCPPPPPPKGPSTGIGMTIGVLALAGGAVIGYAKYDPDFRTILTEYVPFTDEVIKVVFQEEKTFMEYIREIFDSLTGSGDGAHSHHQPVKEVPKDYHPPSPLFPGVVKEIKEEEVKYNEIRLESKDKDTPEPLIEIVDPKPPEMPLPPDHPKNLVDIERDINNAASQAVKAYNTAIYALKNYMMDVDDFVENSVDKIDPSIWSSLKVKAIAKEEAITKAEDEAAVAMRNLKKLKDLITRNASLTEDVKDQAIRNLNKVSEDIATAKRELEAEKKMSNIADKYWNKVSDARQTFADELKILFPNMDLSQKKIGISEGDLDLFIIQAMSKVMFYQKELYRMETLGDERLGKAVDAARKGGLEVLTTEQVCKEMDKSRRKIEEEFQKKCLKLRKDSEHELRLQLKLQSEAFADHLNDAVKTRELELERKLTRAFDEQLTEERCKFKTQVAGMIGRLRGLDGAIKARTEADKAAHQAQVLWSACQALYKSIKVGCPGLPWTDQLRPLEPEITAVESAAAENDELVKVVVQGIPEVAKNRGVYPEDALRERFIKVEKMASRLSLVPEAGGRLHMYLLSFLQSMLLVKAANPIPQSELNDEKTDFTNLSTNEIFQRARYWLDRGDFAQTLKYMNLLSGAPRVISKEWMEEARILLETQQAANTLMAHAAASGLIYL